MATSAAYRKAIASLLVPGGAIIGTLSTFNNTKSNCTFAESKSETDSESFSNNSAQKNGLSQPKIIPKNVILQKRMTPIGRFSLISETPSNPSVPTFFLALSGTPKKSYSSSFTFSQNQGITAPEFESIWIQRNIPNLHPRFHCKVSSTHYGYFDHPVILQSDNHNNNYKNDNHMDTLTELHKHTSEKLHTTFYRQDLKQRIEQFLSTPLSVTDKLWEVHISSGELGASGAISKSRVHEIQQQQLLQQQNSHDNLISSSHSSSKLIESLLLFRCHHSLGDAVSLVAALGDLLDEAQDIRDMIQQEIQKRKDNLKKMGFLKKIYKLISYLIWFILGSISAVSRQMYYMLTTRVNPFLQVLQSTSYHHHNINDITGRSVSWCDVAPVDEVKRIAKAFGNSITINDVFVSCVTAAVMRQLAEHQSRSLLDLSKDSNRKATMLPKNINVVIPAHLTGGILPPGRGIGNLIGAFVARVPGDIHSTSNNSSHSSTASDRLLKVHKSLDSVKKTPAPFVSYYMATFVSNWLPDKWASSIMKRCSANAAVAITNARGYPSKVHINGRTVESMAGFLPLPPGLPVGVVVQSYGSVISLSVNAEKWAVPDADKFLEWILHEYKLLCNEVDSSRKLHSKS